MTRYDLLHLIIALALHLGLDMSQADIKSVFLNGDLNEEVGIMPLPGIGLDGKVLRLLKSLYGLKQDPLAWFERLSSALAEMGFLSCYVDPLSRTLTLALTSTFDIQHPRICHVRHYALCRDKRVKSPS